MECLLSTPVAPLEVMPGKLMPYVFVGLLQATLVLGAAGMLFGVPCGGSLFCWRRSDPAVHHDNLAIGYTFSTFAKTQLQAVQMVGCSSFRTSCCRASCSPSRHADLGAMGQRAACP